MESKTRYNFTKIYLNIAPMNFLWRVEVPFPIPKMSYIVKKKTGIHPVTFIYGLYCIILTLLIMFSIGIINFCSGLGLCYSYLHSFYFVQLYFI